jgi:hypothetical protein
MEVMRTVTCAHIGAVFVSNINTLVLERQGVTVEHVP